MLKTILLKHILYLLAQRIGLEDEIVISQFLYGTIQKASVFSQLALSPYIWTKVSTSDGGLEKDDSDTSRIKVVSSVYWEILVSVYRTLNPLISLLFLTALPRSTSQTRTRYEDNGHPCITPLLKGKKSDTYLLFWTQLLMSLWKSLHQAIN